MLRKLLIGLVVLLVAEHRAVARAVPLEIAFAEGLRSVRVYDKDGLTIDAASGSCSPTSSPTPKMRWSGP
jgi:hypothetical protein